ncbi:MAG: polysaccharide deacetylase family protein [Isosphaeraceae bacterium]
MSGATKAPSQGSVPVLMYHSISDGSGPTRIAPEVFQRQMAILEESGYQVVSLLELGEWIRGWRDLPPRSTVLTFDDGFLDFATTAFPELKRRRWPVTVFLPVGHVGGTDRWDARRCGGTERLMDWATVAELAKAGVDFGAHGVTHRDLTQLGGDLLADEVLRPKAMIEERLTRLVTSFAAPFGRSSAAVLDLVRRSYRQAVTTELAQARNGSDPYTIPRIEMWYFRDPRRWAAFLRGDAKTFLLARRLLRGLRRMPIVNPRRAESAGSTS